MAKPVRQPWVIGSELRNEAWVFAMKWANIHNHNETYNQYVTANKNYGGYLWLIIPGTSNVM